MNNTQLTTLINGGNVTRWSSLAKASEAATSQAYYTVVLLGCDGRYWVPATPLVARQLLAAGYQAAA